MNLRFEKVSASYGTSTIWEDISFSAAEGSVTALVGRNGAGKSTLIRCLMGEKQDYRGRITLDGADVRRMNMAQRSTLLACLPQNLPRPRVTVRELVCFGRTPYTPLSGRLSEKDRNIVSQAIRAVGLSGLEDRFVDDLSGGERKKAFFAMTLAQDTPVVILDEPTAHLDTASRFDFLALLETLRRETGKTFLVVMHDLPDVLRCADTIVTIHDKTVVFDGTAEQFLAGGLPRRCFGIEIEATASGYAAVPIAAKNS